MNKVELETMEHIKRASSRVSGIYDTWDISCSYKELVKLEDEMNCSNHEYSGEARAFFQKSLNDLKNELRRKVLAMIRKEEEPSTSPEVTDEEEGIV